MALLLLPFFLSLSGFSLPASGAELQVELQTLIDSAEPGETLRLKGKVYHGRITIDKPLTLIGQAGTIIDGQNEGSVITVNADRTEIRNLSIRNSGKRHDKLDSGISLLSSDNKIIRNKISSTLFGISLKEAHRNLIEDNTISSFYSDEKELNLRDINAHHASMDMHTDSTFKGDGLRIWASNHNIVRKNRLTNVQDAVMLYSNDNRFEENTVGNSRYGIHLMYTANNHIVSNRFTGNVSGIVLMYGKKALVQDNIVRNSVGAVGFGITLKEVDDIQLIHNQIIHSHIGIFIDRSPLSYGSFVTVLGNSLLFNFKAIEFYGSQENNIIKGNSFVGNLDDVITETRRNALGHVWEGNYWDSYEGMDENKDGYGDASKVQKKYLDNILLENDDIKFFWGSPSLSLLSMINKLVPLVEPETIMEDSSPVFKNDKALLLSDSNLEFRLPFDEDELEDADETNAWFRYLTK